MCVFFKTWTFAVHMLTSYTPFFLRRTNFIKRARIWWNRATNMCVVVHSTYSFFRVSCAFFGSVSAVHVTLSTATLLIGIHTFDTVNLDEVKGLPGGVKTGLQTKYIYPNSVTKETTSYTYFMSDNFHKTRNSHVAFNYLFISGIEIICENMFWSFQRQTHEHISTLYLLSIFKFSIEFMIK